VGVARGLAGFVVLTARPYAASKLGAAPFTGLTVTASVAFSLLLDHYGDAVLGIGPELLDDPVIEFLRPFSREENDAAGPAVHELRTVSPVAVQRVRERHKLRIARVPAILGGADFLDRGLAREGRQRRPRFEHDEFPSLE